MPPRRSRAQVAIATLRRVEALGLGPDECWPWPGGCNKQGYGRAWCEGGYALAHRLVYEATRGKPAICALHDCDNPPCCNPKHLFNGTRTDNARDRDAKQRMPRGDAHYLTVHEDTAIAALRECVAEGASIADAARALGMTYKYAWKLVNEPSKRAL